ncbi:DUF6262 family protein [Dermabacteraceae bacterium P13095]
MTYDKQKHLSELHERHRRRSAELAEAAINELLKEGKAVTFGAVSKRSGLAASTLYSNEHVRCHIEKLRDKQPKEHATKRWIEAQSESATVESLKRLVKRLKEENKQLQD